MNSKMISLNEMREIMKNSPNTILVDVRSRQEFNEGHLNEAVNIPLLNIKNYSFHSYNAIILYCNAGMRSMKAKTILERLGYNNVFILNPNF